jgi:polyvinyl alcohol dehydrogenase (cytochrome)
VVDGSTVYVGVSSQEEFSSLSSLLGKAYTCCSFRGSVVAVDVATGQIRWQTHTISDALYYADAGTLSGWAGVAIWSSTPVVDRKRNQLYVTTGNNYHNAPEADAGASEGNYVDSVIALDMTSGAIKWVRSFPKGGEDIWSTADMSGPDSDFGAGANLFTATVKGVQKDLVGAGQKSGMYWALDADTGETVWSIQVGPGGHLGGIHWGTATDGVRIYVEDNFEGTTPLVLGGTGKMAGQMVSTGTWSALDTSSGDILWQIPNPVLAAPLNGASCNGPVAVTNGVLFAGSMDAAGTMFAFNAATGDQLWQFPSGGTVYGGPAIVGGVVYWGSGYPSSVRPLGFGTSSRKLYAFGLGLTVPDGGAPEAGTDDAAPPGDATSQ